MHDVATSLTYNRKLNKLYGKEQNRGLHLFIQLYGIHHLPASRQRGSLPFTCSL